MRHAHWLSSVAELSLIIATALFSVVAFGQDEKKSDEAKPMPPKPPVAQPAAPTIDIQVPELEVRGPARGPRPSEYWIGLESYPAHGALSAQLGLPEGEGLVVESVAPEGPAAKAGLRRHDILLSVGDVKLHRLEELGKLIADSHEKPIEFKVLRAGKTITVSLQPAKRPFPKGPEFPPQFEERLNERLGQPGGPFRMRFFHPGIVVQLGEGRFPGDVSVNVTKDANGQTHVEVRKGDQNYSVTTDNLGELPATVRGLAEQLLGGGLGELFQSKGPAPGPPAPGRPLSEAPPAVSPGVPVPPPAINGPAPPALPGPNARLEERLEIMQRHMEQMHKELNELRNRQLPPSGESRGAPQDTPKPKPSSF